MTNTHNMVFIHDIKMTEHDNVNDILIFHLGTMPLQGRIQGGRGP